MAKSTRYFQLTPNILLEYNYVGNEIRPDTIALGESEITIVRNSNDNTSYLFPKNADNTGLYCDSRNFVTPINKSNTKFVKYHNDTNDKYYTNTSLSMFVDEDKPSEFELPYDTVRLHFTSRNFIGDYDGLIFQFYIYCSDKKKISLMSFVIRRFDNVTINPNPMLINQTLYTSYIDTRIFCTEKLLNPNGDDNISHIVGTLIYDDETRYKEEKYGVQPRILKNTPVIVSVYGITGINDRELYDIYNCEQINTITIPCKDLYDNVYVDIKESDKGDYFEISVKTTNNDTLSDFISNIDEHPESYVLLHEISLTEYYIDGNTDVRSEVTSRENIIINAASETDGLININEDGLETPITYRPICKHGSRCISFVITDTVRIVNTNDNTTIVKKGELSYGANRNKPNEHASKYGKYINRIYLCETPTVVNVYNRRSRLNDEDNDYVKLSHSKGNGHKIENNVTSITAFCETTNIRIQVVET